MVHKSLFADDLGALISGQLGIRYTDQCIDLERKIGLFSKELSLYSVLSIQTINVNKTVAMFSSRAIGRPRFDIALNAETAKKTKIKIR